MHDLMHIEDVRSLEKVPNHGNLGADSQEDRNSEGGIMKTGTVKGESGRL